MFAINGDKAFRLDGFFAHFFKVAWSTVGDDVVKAIMYFFQTKKLLLAFNATIVALVLNCPNHGGIKDFRPIFCCSVVYKCITKIMDNKLKEYMPFLVGSNQSSSIPSKTITDNIHMAQELVIGNG